MLFTRIVGRFSSSSASMCISPSLAHFEAKVRAPVRTRARHHAARSEDDRRSAERLSSAGNSVRMNGAVTLTCIVRIHFGMS